MVDTSRTAAAHPLAPPPEQTMKIRPYKRLEFWAALALILCFFLPWTTLRGTSPLTGYQLADSMRQSSSLASGFAAPPPSYAAFAAKTVQPPDTSGEAVIAILIYLIPIGAILTVLIDPITHNSRPAIIYFLIAILPFLILALTLQKIGTNLFQKMTFGAYLTLAAAALCAIGLLRSPRAPNNAHRTSTP